MDELKAEIIRAIASSNGISFRELMRMVAYGNFAARPPARDLRPTLTTAYQYFMALKELVDDGLIVSQEQRYRDTDKYWHISPYFLNASEILLWDDEKAEWFS